MNEHDDARVWARDGPSKQYDRARRRPGDARHPLQEEGSMDLRKLERFAAFAEGASALRRASLPEARLPQFATFTERAAPVMLEHLRGELHEYRDELAMLCRWIVPTSSEILGAAGLAGDEVRYTRLVAWMLFPPGHERLALECQRSWLRSLGLSQLAQQIEAPARPEAEVVTDEGRADLVLHYACARHLLIVEAKVDAEEYVSDDGEAQTMIYPRSVRKRRGLAPDYPGTMLFLTPDGREPASQEALPCRFDRLVEAVLQALDGRKLPDDLRWAYATVATHLLAHASPHGADAATGLREIAQWLRQQESAPSDEELLRNLTTLGPLLRGITSRSAR